MHTSSSRYRESNEFSNYGLSVDITSQMVDTQFLSFTMNYWDPLHLLALFNTLQIHICTLIKLHFQKFSHGHLFCFFFLIETGIEILGCVQLLGSLIEIAAI